MEHLICSSVNGETASAMETALHLAQLDVLKTLISFLTWEKTIFKLPFMEIFQVFSETQVEDLLSATVFSSDESFTQAIATFALLGHHSLLSHFLLLSQKSSNANSERSENSGVVKLQNTIFFEVVDVARRWAFIAQNELVFGFPVRRVQWGPKVEQSLTLIYIHLQKQREKEKKEDQEKVEEELLKKKSPRMIKLSEKEKEIGGEKPKGKEKEREVEEKEKVLEKKEERKEEEEGKENRLGKEFFSFKSFSLRTYPLFVFAELLHPSPTLSHLFFSFTLFYDKSSFFSSEFSELRDADLSELSDMWKKNIDLITAKEKEKERMKKMFKELLTALEPSFDLSLIKTSVELRDGEVVT